MKKYLLFLRDDILCRIGKLPFGIVWHYIWFWCTSAVFLWKANLHYALRKHRYLISYLDRHYGHLVPKAELTEHNWRINKAKEKLETVLGRPGGGIDELPIWVFWYQGEEAMPELIKQCYRSICINANGRKVILITKQNIGKYVEMPRFIMEKVSKGYITFTHLPQLSLPPKISWKNRSISGV